MSLIRQAKKTVLAGAKATGGLAMVRRSPWRTNRLMILCYHGISKLDEHDWNPGLYIRPRTFRRRMEILRAGGYAVLDLTEALQRLTAGTLPPRAVAITFDDGAHDFYTLAWPVLREFGFPATLYLTTWYSVHQLPVFDVICSYILWKGRVPDWRAVNRSIYHRVREENTSGADKDTLARELAARHGVDYEEIRSRRLLYLMTPEEAAEVSRGGVTLDLHTHRHRTPRDPALFRDEIVRNSELITEISGRKPIHFCYPSGDYAPEYFAWLKDLGVESATTCHTGLAAKSSNPFELPRLLDVETLSDLEFEAWLTGFSAVLPSRY